MLKNPRLRLGATLWLLSMSGVVVLAFMVIPQLLARSAQQVPLSVALTASIVQSGVLLLLAVWAGVALSKPLGLGAPVIEAALSGSEIWPVLRRQLVPAAIVGMIVGSQLAFSKFIAPAKILAVIQTIELPIAAKVLYGGVTEEVLMRWGAMTAMIWLPWRLLQKKIGLPEVAYVIGAILVTAVLFGVGHLPATAAIGIELTGSVVAYIIIANSVPGILFGFLYWRYGIEAAIIAHAGAHVVGLLATVT